MSAWLIATVGFVYLAVAVEQYVKGNVPMAITFSGYAFSNIGLWWMAR